MKRRLLLTALTGLLLLSSFAVARNGYELSWWTVDGGGGTLSNGSYSLSGTVGQAEAGAALEEDAYTLIGGYWYGAGKEAKRYELYLPSVIR